MQDYSDVQYRVLSSLFPCKKTILGDINQSMNPFSSSGLDTIENIFPDATCMTILKSYRSTFEITQFTKKIRENIAIEAIERRGDEPQVHSFKTEKDELIHIQYVVEDFLKSNLKSLGIILKTQHQADKLHEALIDKFQISLLNALSVAFGSGFVITTTHLAKGLEFDAVIVPQVTHKNYNTEPDRQMLYVACARAMHQLYLTGSGRLSGFIP